MRLIKKILKLSQSSLWFYGLLNGVAANIELLPLVYKIKNLNTIIDVGSNKGQFILLILKFFPKIKIYSFEPIKELLERQKNLFNFRRNIYNHKIRVEFIKFIRSEKKFKNIKQLTNQIKKDIRVAKNILK